MSVRISISALCLCAGLAACGDTIGEQTLAGGVLGAGAAALTSGNLAKGAAIGAAGNLAYCQINPSKCTGY